ncbi:MAG: 30S ribosomal protein S13 [Bacillota bacterium]
MARISGVDLPRDKRIVVALTRIYGIGMSLARDIVEQAGIDENTRVRDLAEVEVSKLRQIIDDNVMVEGELRRENQQNIRRLMDIGCYRGIRHRRGMPVRGQRTKTNARTRKGPTRRVGRRRG